MARSKQQRTNYVRRVDRDSPVAGAYVSYTIPMSGRNTTGALQTNATHTGKINLPAGQKVVLYGFTVRAKAVASDPSVTIGNSTDADGYRTAFNLATNTGFLKLNGALAANSRAESAAGGEVRVTVVNDAGDTYQDLVVTVHGYVSEHADNVP